MNTGIAKNLSKSLILITIFSILLFLIFDFDFHLENETLFLLLSTIFTGLIHLAVSIIAGHAFFQNRDSNVLFISCGMLALGISAMITGFVRLEPSSVNTSVTIYNACAFFGSVCHLTAAVKKRKKLACKWARLAPLLAYMGTVLFVLIVSAGAVKGILPPFVHMGGFTLLRNILLISSIAFYFASAVEFRRQYINRKSEYLFWYTQSLLMMSIGLFGIGVAARVGTLVGWAGRFAYYIGAIFALLSMIAVYRKTKEKGSSYAAVMEEFFANDSCNFRNLAELTTNAVLSIDDTFHILFANTGATALLACARKDLLNASLLDFLEGPHKALLQGSFEKHAASGVNDLAKPTEISMVNRQGQAIALEVAATYQNVTDGYVCTYFMQDITERKKAERALQKALNLNTEIVESISDGFFALNSDWRFTYINRHSAQSVGFEPHELLGKNIWEQLPDLSGGKMESSFRKAMVEKVPVHLELEGKTSGRTYNQNIYPSADGITVYWTDVTDRKETEKALHETKNNLACEIDALNTLYELNSNFIIQADLDTVYASILQAAAYFTHTTKGCIQLYDGDAEKLKIIKGIGLGDAFLRYFSSISLDAGTCGKAYRDKKRCIEEDVRLSPLFIGKPALQYFSEDGIVCVQSTPLISSKGKFVGVLNTYYAQPKVFSDRVKRLLDMLARLAADVIDRTIVEDSLAQFSKELSRQNRLLQAINDVYDKSLTCPSVEDFGDICLDTVEAMTDSTISFIGELSENGMLHNIAISMRGWDQCTMYGSGDHPKETGDFAAHGLYGSVLCNGATLLTNYPSGHPLSIGLPPGHPPLTSFLGVPFIENGKVIGMIAVGNKEGGYTYRDREVLETITPTVMAVLLRKRAEENNRKLVEELKKADENKNEFISALSHELRNPLASVVAGLSLLSLTNDRQEIILANEVIQRQVKQLTHLVDDLLDLTRITNNKIHLKKEKIELLSLVSTVADDHRLLFDRKGICLDVSLGAQAIFLDADPVRIKQIIGNLVQNAAKFTDQGGHVVLAACMQGREALIRVKDDGIGIRPEFLSDLFEPFKQADTSIDRSNSGLGLGLSIVKGIAQLHGGSVRAYSEGPGKGSEFVICLPALPDQEGEQFHGITQASA